MQEDMEKADLHMRHENRNLSIANQLITSFSNSSYANIDFSPKLSPDRRQSSVAVTIVNDLVDNDTD